MFCEEIPVQPHYKNKAIQTVLRYFARQNDISDLFFLNLKTLNCNISGEHIIFHITLTIKNLPFKVNPQ
jgi:hypothetical protein